MYFFLPTIIPAWGPPSNLSPEKETTSTPAFIESCTVGSYSKPYSLRSIKTPLPISSITGMSFSLPSLQSSSIDTLSVNPSILKLLVCTFKNAPVFSLIASS